MLQSLVLLKDGSEGVLNASQRLSGVESVCKYRLFLVVLESVVTAVLYTAVTLPL